MDYQPSVLPVTIVETPEFLSACSNLLDAYEQAFLVDYLALNPSAGNIIPGTGGVRKLRWALTGRGKRGGARVIYFYHSEAMPLFLLTIYAKNERDDISAGDRNAFKRLTTELVRTFETRKK